MIGLRAVFLSLYIRRYTHNVICQSFPLPLSLSSPFPFYHAQSSATSSSSPSSPPSSPLRRRDERSLGHSAAQREEAGLRLGAEGQRDVDVRPLLRIGGRDGGREQEDTLPDVAPL